jgi:hypothetical protein
MGISPSERNPAVPKSSSARVRESAAYRFGLSVKIATIPVTMLAEDSKRVRMKQDLESASEWLLG